jgi:hypothetical protein
MGIILPDASVGHAQTGRDDRHVEKAAASRNPPH